LKTDDTKFPARALAQAGLWSIWHGQRAHHGVAILAGRDAARVAARPSRRSADVATRYIGPK
jgi:exonuclease III